MDDSFSSLEQALLAATRPPYPAVPAARQTVNRDAAYAIQRSVHQVSALPVMVWKIGLTGKVVREAFGASEPIVGRLAASAIYSNRSEADFIGPEMYAEAEMVFELGSDLPPQSEPYTRADLCAALKGIWGGIEIVRTRFMTSDLSLPLLIADNSMAHGLVLGRKLSTGWEDRFANLPVSLTRNSEAPVEGSTTHVMGNPLDAVVWLANWLRDTEGHTLKREQLIASGTCTGATKIFAGDTIRVDFDGAEAARITLCAPR